MFVSFGKMVILYDLKKSSEILKSTAFSEELTKLFKYLMKSTYLMSGKL
jgi:hypothetical protein